MGMPSSGPKLNPINQGENARRLDQENHHREYEKGQTLTLLLALVRGLGTTHGLFVETRNIGTQRRRGCGFTKTLRQEVGGSERARGKLF